MNTIITIGRSYGSGGHTIGEMLAKKLNIKFYDKELLKRAAEESGLCPEIFENHDEKPTNSFLYNLVMDTYSFGFNGNTYVDMPISHKVFLAQFEAIKKIAQEGPCVIVGRCADYALADMDNCIHTFIYANMEDRIKRIQEVFDLDDKAARESILKKDKQRANYYNYYSSHKWGQAETYDLCVNSSILGYEGTVDLLTQFIQDFETQHERK